MILQNTPWETHEIKSPNGPRKVHVKREDLCCEEAHFSKLRGVEAHLRSRPEKYIGVLDTRHSKAGWGVSALCKSLGKQAVVYYPIFKHLRGLRQSQVRAKGLGAKLEGLTAARSFILYNRAQKHLTATYPEGDAYMMPNALKLTESVQETADEVERSTPAHLLHSRALWVVSISSGTIAAGVIKGLHQMGAHCTVVLHMGYTRGEKAVIKYIQEYTDFGELTVALVDEGYSYADAVSVDCPFPCNPYYDLKAWKWLCQDGVRQCCDYRDIVFWNIGA